MAEDAPFGTPLLTPEILPKNLCGSLFGVLSQEMRHINFFRGDPKWGLLGGGQKVYVEKVHVQIGSRISRRLVAMPRSGKVQETHFGGPHFADLGRFSGGNEHGLDRLGNGKLSQTYFGASTVQPKMITKKNQTQSRK